MEWKAVGEPFAVFKQSFTTNGEFTPQFIFHIINPKGEIVAKIWALHSSDALLEYRSGAVFSMPPMYPNDKYNEKQTLAIKEIHLKR
jgi:hypothetical protein